MTTDDRVQADACAARTAATSAALLARTAYARRVGEFRRSALGTRSHGPDPRARNRDRIEIALRRDGEIIFPENRYLPRRDALANHGWVQSGPILLEVRLPHPLTRALAVTAGREHSCTITEAQAIICWGSNRMGQLDAPSGRFTSISAGRYHTCALDVRGEVTCWGDSDFRQTQAPKGPFTAIEAAGDHTCGLTEQERLKC